MNDDLTCDQLVNTPLLAFLETRRLQIIKHEDTFPTGKGEGTDFGMEDEDGRS